MEDIADTLAIIGMVVAIVISIIIYIIFIADGIKKRQNKIIIRNKVILDIIFLTTFEIFRFINNKVPVPTPTVVSSITPRTARLLPIAICFYCIIFVSLIICIIGIIINIVKNKKIQKNPWQIWKKWYNSKALRRSCRCSSMVEP